MAKKKDATAPVEPTSVELWIEGALGFLRTYQNAIVALAILIVVGVLLVSWKVSANQAREEEAWAQLADARKKQGLELDEALKKLEATYSGTSVAPYAAYLRASRLVTLGGKKELEEARDALTKLLASYPQHSSYDLVRRAAQAQLDGVKKELDDARTWRALESKTAPPGAPPPPK